jgi:hypothetical protein
VADGTAAALTVLGTPTRILVHDARSGARLRELDSGGLFVSVLGFDGHGRLAAASGLSGAAALWQAETGRLLRAWSDLQGAPSTCAWTPAASAC